MKQSKAPLAAIAGILVTTVLAGCQSDRPKDYTEFPGRQDPFTVASRIADNAGACWFKGDRPAFAGLIYAPELASAANRPRVLVVPKGDPTGLPKLVVEASRAERGTRVKLFGPLMASAEAPAIARDVERWAAGSTGCG